MGVLSSGAGLSPVPVQETDLTLNIITKKKN